MDLDRFNSLTFDLNEKLTPIEIEQGWHFCPYFDGFLCKVGFRKGSRVCKCNKNIDLSVRDISFWKRFTELPSYSMVLEYKPESPEVVTIQSEDGVWIDKNKARDIVDEMLAEIIELKAFSLRLKGLLKENDIDFEL